MTHNEPRHLFDDPAVSSSLREDVARAGEAYRADAAAYDTASKLSSFHAALASQVGGAAGMAPVAKLLLSIAGAVAFMLAGAAMHAWLQRDSRPASDGAPTTDAVHPPIAPPPKPQAAEAPVTPPAGAPQRSTDSQATDPQAQRPASRKIERDGAPHEVRQLARIRALLHAGDAASALNVAERGHRELGQSALWHEREALAVLALLELDRAEQAAARGASLLTRFPDSPFRAELERRLREAHAP